MISHTSRNVGMLLQPKGKLSTHCVFIRDELGEGLVMVLDKTANRAEHRQEQELLTFVIHVNGV